MQKQLQHWCHTIFDSIPCLPELRVQTDPDSSKPTTRRSLAADNGMYAPVRGSWLCGPSSAVPAAEAPCIQTRTDVLAKQNLDDLHILSTCGCS